MSPMNRFEGEFPHGGTARQRQGGCMSPMNRFEGEFPHGGTAQSAKGAA